jgi:hypothetical protein
MSGQAAVKTRKEVLSDMKSKDVSTSSNKHGRYSGGDPVCHPNYANKPIKHDGSAKQKV